MRTNWLWILTIAVLVSAASGDDLCLRQVAYVPSGITGHGEVVCGDSDHDSLAEFSFWRNTPGQMMWRWELWEERPMNRYELVKSDTCIGNPYPPPGMHKGLFAPCDIGDVDEDGLVEVVGVNVEYTADTIYNYLCLYESPDSSSYPDSLVWSHLYGTNYTTTQCRHVWFPGDLDRDGLEEIVHADGSWGGAIFVFENRGDNQCVLVDSTPRGYYGPDIAFGDFDLDGQQEFVTFDAVSHDWIWVFECAGDDSFALVCSLPSYSVNGYDICSGRDLDRDGRPEWYVKYQRYQPDRFYLCMYEATGNNTYVETLLDSFSSNATSDAENSVCVDLDLDGIEELLVSYNAAVRIYQATGNNQYQAVYQWDWPLPGTREAQVRCYDMNGNLYPDILISGCGHTWILEVEAIRVLAPNGGENLVPGDTCWIQWQTFNPPRCDSVSLFLRRDTTWQLDTIATGLASTDTLHPWLVPPGPVDSCWVVAMAYGPGWQYDESDAPIRITPGGVSETEGSGRVKAEPVVPTLLRGVLWMPGIEMTNAQYPMTLLDVAGKRAMYLQPGENDVRHLSPGVYFIRPAGTVPASGIPGDSPLRAKVIITR